MRSRFPHRTVVIPSVSLPKGGAGFTNIGIFFKTDLPPAVSFRRNLDLVVLANDFLYQWESSRDYDPSAGLERIQAALLAINSADDERNPPETGITERELKRVKSGRLYLIPASEDTRGHGTTGIAKFYTQQLRELLGTAPRRTM
jgi:hypothetical protein